MFKKQYNIAVGITTFCTEMLRISVPVLGRKRGRFILIIHNDNPGVVVTRRQIRRMGYRGPLMIINSTENVGLLRSRMAIVGAVAGLKHVPEWLVFCDDDDMLVGVDAPKSSPDIFAVIQNGVVVRHRLSDLLHIIQNPNDIIVDGENVVMARPHVGVTGTLIKTNVLIPMVGIINEMIPAIQKLDDGLGWRAPVDAIMWSWINTFAHHINPNVVPVYMDNINYVVTRLDSAPVKYNQVVAPARNVAGHYARALEQYDKLFADALQAAALRG